MITLSNLSFIYPKASAPAITDANAQFSSGIHLLLGENGAGKTTLLHLIAGLLFPSQGTVDIDGCQPQLRIPSLQSRIFFVADTLTLPGRTINEFSRVHSPFYPTFSPERFATNLEAFAMTGHEVFTSLSLGNRKKAILAYALALRVEVLLLDEPANGLDITSKQIFQRLMAEQIDPERQTVILSTHTVSDFEYLYDGVAIISRSKLLFALSSWKIAEALRFTTSPIPPTAPLYMEQRLGSFHAIEAAEPAQPSDGSVNFTLLYNAVMSPARQSILNAINKACNNE